MTSDLIKELFGISDTEYDEIRDILSKAAKNSDNNNKTKSYCNILRRRYNNGKLVEKNEKEYVNGQCVKDENYVRESKKREKIKSILAKAKDIRLKKRGVLANKIEELESKNNTLQNQINDMTQYIDGLNDKIKKLELEKAELQSIIDNVKRCF